LQDEVATLRAGGEHTLAHAGIGAGGDDQDDEGCGKAAKELTG
jgi:hypothetical protein